jgi:hypothetical protein
MLDFREGPAVCRMRRTRNGMDTISAMGFVVLIVVVNHEAMLGFREGPLSANIE